MNIYCFNESLDLINNIKYIRQTFLVIKYSFLSKSQSFEMRSPVLAHLGASKE